MYREHKVCMEKDMFDLRSVGGGSGSSSMKSNQEIIRLTAQFTQAVSQQAQNNLGESIFQSQESAISAVTVAFLNTSLDWEKNRQEDYSKIDKVGVLRDIICALK